MSGTFGQFTGLYVSNTVTTGTTSVSITLSSSFVSTDCLISEVAGLAVTSPIDQSSGQTYQGTTTGNATAFTGAVTSTNTNDVIIGMAEVFPVQTLNPGTGYATLGTIGAGSPFLSAIVVYQVVTSTGTYNPGVTWATSGPSQTGTGALKLQ